MNNLYYCTDRLNSPLLYLEKNVFPFDVSQVLREEIPEDWEGRVDLKLVCSGVGTQRVIFDILECAQGIEEDEPVSVVVCNAPNDDVYKVLSLMGVQEFTGWTSGCGR